MQRRKVLSGNFFDDQIPTTRFAFEAADSHRTGRKCDLRCFGKAKGRIVADGWKFGRRRHSEHTIKQLGLPKTVSCRWHVAGLLRSFAGKNDITPTSRCQIILPGTSGDPPGLARVLSQIQR